MKYHRVLSRAAWCPQAASRTLLDLLVAAFAPKGPIVLGIDDTIECRRGKQIAIKGIYRDPVQSSHEHFIKASGLRWLSLMLLVPIQWARRVWALPFLTALAPSKRYCQERGRRHKKLTDREHQLVLQACRWLPGRELVVVNDNDAADHPAIIDPGHAAWLVWQQRRHLCPLRVSQPEPLRHYRLHSAELDESRHLASLQNLCGPGA